MKTKFTTKSLTPPIRPVLNTAAQRHEVSINGVVVGYVPVPQNSQATARLIGKLRYVAATRRPA
jgi:hypothetical protein